MVYQKLTIMVWFPKNDHNGLMVSQKIDHNGLISKKMTIMVWWFPKNDHNGLMVSQKWPQWLDGYPKMNYNGLISQKMTSMVWSFPSKNDHYLQSIIKKRNHLVENFITQPDTVTQILHLCVNKFLKFILLS